MTATILITDDDPVQRRLIENMVLRSGYHAVTADNGDAALAMLSGPDGARIDAIVLDLVMPGLDGMGVLAQLREKGFDIPVIVQTAHGGIDNVVSAMRAGAQDFVVKPVGLERLQVSLRNALNASALTTEIRRIKRGRDGTLTFADIVTRSEAMENVLRAAAKAAASSIPVLIEGESGVGKEMIARAIHGSSERSAKPFVAVNCGAIPENLVESILFGHDKGAFTGATERHAGKFVEAHGGTLLLDEVGELPPAAQVKLLRALQQNEVEPVGGRKPVKVDVRIVSATNRNLLDEVKAGRFREDLFYRLHVLPLTVPPLRARREDIPHLARHFLARFCAEENRRLDGIGADAMQLLIGAAWPGNVRQLENAIFRAVVMSEGEVLQTTDFPQVAAMIGQAERTGAAPFSPAPQSGEQSGFELTENALPQLAAGFIPLAPQPGSFSPPESLFARPSIALLDNELEMRPLEEIEAEVIRFAIAHYRGQMSEVARRLRIGRSTLYRKMEALDEAGEETVPQSE